MNLWQIYSDNIPDFLTEASASAPMKRLKNIGMNCGCEYTDFHTFADFTPYTRFDHSIGVGLIVWNFTKDRAQALSGLLHDVATPAFAHVIDFFRGDHMMQESTEEGTLQIIEQSNELQQILSKYSLTTEQVCNYHIYPIADNDSPKLSADRLEYTLGNLVNYKFCEVSEIKDFYNDLTVGINEYNQEELMFKTPSVALAFSQGALKCSNLYVSDSDRFAMQALADLLKDAVGDGVITEQDFYITERELIEKLTSCAKYCEKWRKYCSYSKVRTALVPDDNEKWVNVSAKKRYINPYISNLGRVTEVYPQFDEKLEEFKSRTQDYWVCGY